jgi:hypothetical protein
MAVIEKKMRIVEYLEWVAKEVQGPKNIKGKILKF